MSDAIFIAGYYRSGTSALAGALHRVGVGFHNDAEPNEHNPLGFYEIPELIEFDVDLFALLGVEWTDVRGLPEGWWERADLARPLSRLDEILRRRFGHDKIWGLKHPHICRLFPIYERAAAAAGHRPHVIHMCRSPWTVAASQHKKNGLARAHAVLLWLSYLISAERHARHLPRAWVTYQDLLSSPGAELTRIANELGIELPISKHLAEAKKFLTAELNRSEPVSADKLFGPLQDLTAKVWDAVRSRDQTPATWDSFSVACAGMIGFLSEMSQSKGVVIPGFGAAVPHQVAGQSDKVGLRPAERVDEGAKQRLLTRKDEAAALPSLTILIAVPPNRAHAIHDTLASIHDQWHNPADIVIVSADPLEIPGRTVIAASGEAGDVTKILCRELNAAAGHADYVAIINAGDTISPDACLRFALEAAGSQADMIYSDEIVPHDKGAWIRYKPGWDITRLRQAAFIGDWVWYRGAAVSRLGGFDPARAGAEEYDFQLRLAEICPRVSRLPEAVFTRAKHSRRDNIPSTDFGPRAVDAVADHLRRMGISGEVQPREHLGLFRHVRQVADPATSVILLCDGLDLATLDRWMNNLLGGAVLSGPVILAGAALAPQVITYLSAVAAQESAPAGDAGGRLGDTVRAVAPQAGYSRAAAMRQAIGMVTTEHVVILDGRSAPLTANWIDNLRGCLADPRVAAAGARTLLQLSGDQSKYIIQGPIIIGADTRLGAGHLADDPGPGGWLAVEQEASAVVPSAVLFRRDALAACRITDLPGDALWADLCAQLRQAGHAVVWTPDVSFVSIAEAIRPDTSGLSFPSVGTWEDPYHHPALSLRGDLLAPEQKLGIVRSGPMDHNSLLLTGPADAGVAVINAARALRGTGRIEAGWAPDVLLPAEIGRRAPSAWVRINPEREAAAGSMDAVAIFTTMPAVAAKPVVKATPRVFATSPEIQQGLQKMLPPGRRVELWRPALSRVIWQTLAFATAINSKPRILWVDEGIAPAWFAEIISQTLPDASWIVVERPGTSYAGSIARIRRPEDEQSWARELAAVSPHILVRPADTESYADCYVPLIAAAAGCQILQDERLDMPHGISITALPNRIAAWQRAIQKALTSLPATLAQGQQARAAALALPAIEENPPAWISAFSPGVIACAAE